MVFSSFPDDKYHPPFKSSIFNLNNSQFIYNHFDILTYSSGKFQYFSCFHCDDILAWVYLLKGAAENLLRKQYVNISIFSPLGFKSVFEVLHSNFSFDAATFLYTIYVFNIVILVKNYLYLNLVPRRSVFYAVDYLKSFKYPVILFYCYLGKYNDAFTFGISTFWD